MGVGEDKIVPKSPKTHEKERHLYRAGSLGSQLGVGGDGDLKYENGGSVPLTAINGNGSVPNLGMRSRHSSGKSIRSRTASRAEYHEDLKPSLKQGLTTHLLLLSFVILFGSSFHFGYNIGVLNQPSDLIKAFIDEAYSERYGIANNATADNETTLVNTKGLSNDTTTPAGAISKNTQTLLWALTTTMFVPGGMIGSLTTGMIADKMGRKRAILLSHLFAFIGAIMSACCVLAKSPELLIIGRFFTGINCGMAGNLAPMYIMEITPFNLRGAFGCACQLFVTLGIFIGAVVGLRELLGTETLWPYILLLNIVPVFVSLVILPCLPDSPRYLLLVKQKRLAAEKALQWLRQKDDIVTDVEEMETESEMMQKEEEWSMMQLLRARDLWRPLLVACMLMVIQQLSGINAVMFYSKSIYQTAGVPEHNLQYAVLLTAALNFLMTIVAVPVMDKAGRRPLLLYPMGGMIIIFAVLTASLSLQYTLTWMTYLSIGCVAAYVIAFAVGLGPIPWMIGSELFRQGPRPRAMSMAGMTNWFFTIIVSISFPSIQETLKEYTFIIFLVFMIGFLVFVYFLVPETKNKTFEEIASQFQPGGTIEVEEVVEDVFPVEMKQPLNDMEQDTAADADNESTGLMKGRGHGNGPASKLNESEERKNLTSGEDFHVRT